MNKSISTVLTTNKLITTPCPTLAREYIPDIHSSGQSITTSWFWTPVPKNESKVPRCGWCFAPIKCDTDLDDISNPFSGWKLLYSLFKFHWAMFPKVEFTVRPGSYSDLAAITRQAIAIVNDGLVYWSIYTRLLSVKTHTAYSIRYDAGCLHQDIIPRYHLQEIPGCISNCV